MPQLTLEQRVFILMEYFLSNKSIETVRRKFRLQFECEKVPQRSTIYRIIEKFKKTGSVGNNNEGRTGRPASVSTPENIKRIEEAFENSPKKSIRRASQELSIKRESLRKIIHEKLKLYPYKIQLHQPITEKSQEMRLRFASSINLSFCDGDVDVNRIWFSDEAHFHLDGYVNKQNWRIWGSENPHIFQIRTLHPIKVTVWAAISGSGIIGPIFIDGTVKSSNYLQMLKNEFIPQLREPDLLSTFHFMQDGARPHRTSEVFDFLEEKFNNRVIALDYSKKKSKGIDWPPYSPDLNPCDYFLWGYVKDRIYEKKPKNAEELKNAIRETFSSISPDMLSNVVQNFTLRIKHVVDMDGKHIESILN